MNKADTINAFLALKEVISTLSQVEKDDLFAKAAAVNPWFTVENIQRAFDSIVYMLDENNLQFWAAQYAESRKPLKVGIVMAGNLPLVGFHDLLTVLVAGHSAKIKLSSQDEVLPKFILAELKAMNTEFNTRLEVVDKLSNIDAVIATGSDNSSRYFKKYFKEYPHIIRKNRTSVAVLNGSESDSELEALGDDIFSYFGMGCRNVAKIFIPHEYPINRLIDNFQNQGEIVNHPKYFNNYEYNKAIYLVNMVKHLDNGFALFTESADLVSPLSVVYYQHYSDLQEVEKQLAGIADKLQCIVGKVGLSNKMVQFGQAQKPDLSDYADNVDTMKFLTDL